MWKLFCSLRGNSQFKHGSVIVHNVFAYFTLFLSASQVYMIKERSWFSQIDFFVEYFPHPDQDSVSFQSILCHPHTQIRVTLSDGVRTTILNWKPIAFPIIVLPKDDHTDSVQEERLGLRYWTTIWAISVVVDESKCLDTPIWESSIIWEHLPFLPMYNQILRLLLVHRNQAIWK